MLGFRLHLSSCRVPTTCADRLMAVETTAIANGFGGPQHHLPLTWFKWHRDRRSTVENLAQDPSAAVVAVQRRICQIPAG